MLVSRPGPLRKRRDPYLIPAPGVDLPIMSSAATLALCTVVLGCGGHDDLTNDSPGNALPPVLVTDPAPRVVPISTTWAFTLAATGSRLAYQWRRNGQAISGATAGSSAFSPKFLQDGGGLDVVVSNGSGSVTSALIDVKVVNTQGPWQQDLKIAVGSDPESPRVFRRLGQSPRWRGVAAFVDGEQRFTVVVL